VSWVLAFLGFAALIILHELGHFTAAKAVGMRVERFSLFFPPLVARRRRGETEYAIGSIPLGGYVKITGMNPAEEIPPEIAHRAYFRQPVWKRVFVIGAGPAVNIALALILLTAYLLIWGTPVSTPTNDVEALATNGAAAKVLQVGDRVVAVDGKRGTFDQLRHQVNTHRCVGPQTDKCVAATPARLTVERGSETLTLVLRPRYDGTEKRMLIGYSPKFDLVTHGPGYAASTMWNFTSKSVSTIVGIFFNAHDRKQVSGVVGSYEVTRQSFQFSTAQALFLLGAISLSLAIVNLFPFLPLDGGHIFWAVAEKLRGRAIPFSVMERASVIGIALVLFIFVVGFTNDIDRLTGQGFNVR